MRKSELFGKARRDDHPADGAPFLGVIRQNKSDMLISKLPDKFEPEDWKPKKTGMDRFIK